MVADVAPEILAKTRYLARVQSLERMLNATSGTLAVFLEMLNKKLETGIGYPPNIVSIAVQT